MPRVSARQLLAALTESLGRESATLELKWMQDAVRRRPADTPDLPAMVARRVRGEPLQYIIGTQPFGPLELLTRRPVLIPRPETEDWTVRLADFVRPNPRSPISLLDLCTGSGCIPLLLCHLWPRGSVRAVGVDVSEHAVALARDNARICEIHMPTGEEATSLSTLPLRQNTFCPHHADIFHPTFTSSLTPRPPFHIITSNPPYIPKADYDNLPASVKEYEDPRALIGDDDVNRCGLAFYHHIAKLVARGGMLADDGVVAVEVGVDQARDVERIFREEGGLGHTEIWNDPWEKERAVVARKK